MKIFQLTIINGKGDKISVVYSNLGRCINEIGFIEESLHLKVENVYEKENIAVFQCSSPFGNINLYVKEYEVDKRLTDNDLCLLIGEEESSNEVIKVKLTGGNLGSRYVCSKMRQADIFKAVNLGFIVEKIG